MIPRLFKDMPPKGERNKVGKWKIEVRAIFPMRDNVVYSEVYEGKLWKAFLKDMETSGEYYGVGWAIRKG